MADFERYCEVIFWNFERRDNVVYNFNIIISLVTLSAEKNIPQYYKPIVIFMMAVIECTLYDFLKRIQQERYEGINLKKSEKSIIRQKNIVDKLHRYIQICETHGLLGHNEPNIYEGLYKYNKIRNRIHIQNINRHEPPKEWKLWNKTMVKSCGRLLHDLFVYLCETYPRPEDKHSNPDLKTFPTPMEKFMTTYPFHNSPRCGAKTKRNNGAPCRSPAVRGKQRCRIHGGSKGSGAKHCNMNALKHGHTTKKAKMCRKEIKLQIKQWKDFQKSHDS